MVLRPQTIAQYEGMHAKLIEPLSNLQTLMITGQGAVTATRANDDPTPIGMIRQMNGKFGAVVRTIAETPRRKFPQG